MTDPFRTREQAYEAKYQLDEARRFRLTARRDHVFGLWAAAELGLAGDEAEAYARALMEADLTREGEAALIARVLADLTDRGMEMTEGRLRLKLDRFREEVEREDANASS